MNDNEKTETLEEIISRIELPTSAYETAKKRYEDLGEWFGRDESSLADNDVHVFAQGSFRLGTAIKPLFEHEEYDLDLTCKLRKGISRDQHSQFYLKDLVGKEIESYRIARQIQNEKEEKHRCWTLEYKDNLSFHMDIVPALPDEELSASIQESILNFGVLDEVLAEAVSTEAVAITDDRNEKYKEIDPDDWNISNPEGYARWFESKTLKSKMSITLEAAQVDDVPIFLQKQILQKVIMLLKRHRDSMYSDPKICDSKPISIIITTLASQAYNGEQDLAKALDLVLNNMHKYISNDPQKRIPNPVNPKEDFADKWSMSKYKNLKLEENFWQWLEQAKADFQSISNIDNATSLSQLIEEGFALKISKDTLKDKLGLSLVPGAIESKEYVIDNNAVAKPWKKNK